MAIGINDLDDDDDILEGQEESTSSVEEPITQVS
jgi:hypothetical protein